VDRHLAGYARRAFDQGLGRSLWFVEGADPGRLEAALAAFDPARRGDLYAGLGLASAYAGGVDREALARLRTVAGSHGSALAQGAAFAAKARQRAGNLMPHTELACQQLCGMSAEAAAAVTDQCLENLPLTAPEPAYEHWRRRIQAHFQNAVAAPSGKQG
jgi:hypothetical protein